MVFKILEIRTAKGITQQQLTKMTDIKQTTLSAIENRRVMPAFDKMVRISEALDVSLYDLYVK